jgi:hypothetical protein
MFIPEGEPQQIFKALESERSKVVRTNPVEKEVLGLKRWFESQWDALEVEEGFGEEIVLDADWEDKVKEEKSWIVQDEVKRRSLAIKTASAYRLLIQASLDPALKKRRAEDVRLAEGTIVAARKNRRANLPQFVQLGFEYLLEERFPEIGTSGEIEDYIPNSDFEKTVNYFSNLKNRISRNEWSQIVKLVDIWGHLPTKTLIGFEDKMRDMGINPEGMDLESLYATDPFMLDRALGRMK